MKHMMGLPGRTASSFSLLWSLLAVSRVSVTVSTPTPADSFCKNDVELVFQTGAPVMFAESFSLPGIEVISQQRSSVCFRVKQNWTEATYVQYEDEELQLRCVRQPNITNAREIHNATCWNSMPIALVDVWVPDATFASDDFVVVPRCCHRSESGIAPATHYVFQLWCDSQCHSSKNIGDNDKENADGVATSLTRLPAVTTTPGVATPGTTATPGATTAPGAMTIPGATRTPGAMTNPGALTTPGATTTPDTTTNPGMTTPGASMAPGATPRTTATPGATITPRATAAPGETATLGPYPSSSPSSFSVVNPEYIPGNSTMTSTTPDDPPKTTTVADHSSRLPSMPPSYLTNDAPLGSSTSMPGSIAYPSTPIDAPSWAPSASTYTSTLSCPSVAPSGSAYQSAHVYGDRLAEGELSSKSPRDTLARDFKSMMGKIPYSAVQPRWSDEVHAVWINGPSDSAQLGGNWPKFGTQLTGGTSSVDQCDPTNPAYRYTGYDSAGRFCQHASDKLDEYPHFVMYSGNVGMVIDVSAEGGNLIPQLGATSNLSWATGPEAHDVYANLSFSHVAATMDLSCIGVERQMAIATPPAGEKAILDLVRQGHAVTHITVGNLAWNTASGVPVKTTNGKRCDKIYPTQNPDHQNCKDDYGGTHNTCRSPEYPICKGFVSGVLWGRCYEDISARNPDNAACSQDFIEGFENYPCLDPIYPDCKAGRCFKEASKDPTNGNCNQDYGGSHPNACQNQAYPLCNDFQQGVTWGKCYEDVKNDFNPDNAFCNNGHGQSPCSDSDYPICKSDRCYASEYASCFLPRPWIDITMWGDAIALHMHWDGTTASCSGIVQLEVVLGSETITHSSDFSTKSQVSVLLTGEEGGSSLRDATGGDDQLGDLTVSSATAAAVVQRDDFGDVIVEVPTSTPKCAYRHCGNVLAKVDVDVANSNKLESRTLRLTLSRNFETGTSSIPQSRPGAEITGFNVMVWDQATQQPSGIPIHISKNWHSGVGSSMYQGTWWTANTLLHVPPCETLNLTFAIVYEQFKGIPAFSHSQLSIVGHSNMWLWEEAALGTGGENFCMDPLGSHTRAAITDVRPKLFDGKWKGNVGGGDFLLYFNETGSFQYKRGLDAHIHANGPCLSNATYTSLSDDGAIKSVVQVSGARTDDLVRVFLHIRHIALKETKFSRLAFFQMGSETYNYNANFAAFVFGDGSGAVTHDFSRTCSAGTDKASNKMYDSMNNGTNVYREALPGEAPWWLSMGSANKDSVHYTEDPIVLGDRGLVIRDFHGRLGDIGILNPSISVLCNRIELGPPSGLTKLNKGDFVDVRLEMLVLPREGYDFDLAQANSPASNGLKHLGTLNTTWERVREHAVRNIEVTSVSSAARVESHHPIRVCVSPHTSIDSQSVEFTASGRAVGFVPIVICGLASPNVPESQGLWSRAEGELMFTLLTWETDSRQANYIRSSGEFELVFNVEILADGFTEFAFGSDPNLI